MRIINQIEIDEYTVIEVSDQTCFGNYVVIESNLKNILQKSYMIFVGYSLN